MFACYAVFFLGIFIATGRDAATVMMLVISGLYMLMFFGTTKLLNAQKGREHDSPLDRTDGVLDTWTGPMDRHTVAAQILAVYYFAFFLVILPILGLVETARKQPASIADAVLAKRAAGASH